MGLTQTACRDASHTALCQPCQPLKRQLAASKCRDLSTQHAPPMASIKLSVPCVVVNMLLHLSACAGECVPGRSGQPVCDVEPVGERELLVQPVHRAGPGPEPHLPHLHSLRQSADAAAPRLSCHARVTRSSGLSVCAARTRPSLPCCSAGSLPAPPWHASLLLALPLAARAAQRSLVALLTALRMAWQAAALLASCWLQACALWQGGPAGWSTPWPWHSWRRACQSLKPYAVYTSDALTAPPSLWQVGDVDQTPRTHATAVLQNSGMRWCQSSTLGPALAATDPGEALGRLLWLLHCW